ncbi:MAG: LeuA family protein [Spirochaetes bacterium]|jgi:homocitrate synthase NifV|nr:LeuA family protein [Spirochaetota bacterium]
MDLYTKSDNRKIRLVDTTLRDGAQAACINFSYSGKFEIAQSLFRCNIDELEAGIPAMGNEEIDFINRLCREKPVNTRISAWCRNHIDDVKAALLTNAEIIHISLFCSDILQKTFNKTLSEQLSILQNNIAPVLKANRKVSIGLQDVFRTPISLICSTVAELSDMDIFRIRLADSCGCATPGQSLEILQNLRPLMPGELDFHAHNDCGLAAANSLSALEGGADSVSVTVNGIGERAGNTSLTDMAAMMKITNTFSTALNYTELKPVAELVSRYCGIPVSPFSPLIGNHLYIHEAGIHVSALLKNPNSYQPYTDPDYIECNKFLLGPYSSNGSIKRLAQQKGISLTNETITIIKKRINKLCTQPGNEIDASIILQWCTEIANGGKNATSTC